MRSPRASVWQRCWPIHSWRAVRPITGLAEQFVRPDCIPSKAKDDALHLALCAVHGVPYLLTWNFRHLANPENRRILFDVCAKAGYELPVICTPDEMMKGDL